MKKWGLILLGILLILGTVYVLRYKTNPSYEGRIPQGTQSVMSIDLRQIEHHFLMDFLAHPFPKGSAKKDTVASKVDIKSILNSIEIPRDILFFSKDKNGLGNWVSEKVYFKNSFTNALGDLGFKKIEDIYFKDDFVLNVTQEYFNLAYMPHGYEKSIFSDPDQYIEDHVMINKLAQNSNDIYFVSEEHFLSAKFLDGKIEIRGQGDFEALKSHKNSIDTKSLVNFGFGLSDPSKEDYKRTVYLYPLLNKINISGDSLFQNFERTSFGLVDFESTIDTIKTYEYDDDFNKKEIITTQKELLPIYNLKMQNEGAFEYLQSIDAIKNINDENVFVNFPLVKTYVANDNGNISFYSKDISTPMSQIQTNKFYLNLDLERYRQKSKGTSYDTFEKLKGIKRLDLSITEDDEILGDVMMMDGRNALIGLVRGF